MPSLAILEETERQNSELEFFRPVWFREQVRGPESERLEERAQSDLTRNVARGTFFVAPVFFAGRVGGGMQKIAGPLNAQHCWRPGRARNYHRPHRPKGIDKRTDRKSVV